MKLTAKAEYGLRAMIDLAGCGDEQTTLDEIAQRQHIPATVLPAIAQALARAGLLETLRGYGGGVRLARPAEQINVRQVLEALQGPLQLYRCDSARKSCPLGPGRGCSLAALWQQTQGRMLELWQETTLAELTRGRRLGRPAKKRRGSRKRARPGLAAPLRTA